jgi:hypothetical protein
VRIIDARSGRDHIQVGDRIDYPVTENRARWGLPNEDWWQLVAVNDYGLWASAVINGPEGRTTVPLRVRFMHPMFIGQRVAFFPS